MTLFGAGWCVLRSSREAWVSATVDDVVTLDELHRQQDERLWKEFRQWMKEHETPWLLWQLYEHHNNHDGFLQFYISGNHRSSPVWEMLQWIADNSKDSYGLFYAHDDEDVVQELHRYSRGATEDYDNVFRVHRIFKGVVSEMPDPFFGPIVPNIDHVHPYDRQSEDADKD
jgi:hypothetical protein